MTLAGRVALVTGGARGLGKAIAEVLLDSGCAVALVDFRKALGDAAAEELRAKGNCKFFQCDVMEASELERTFKAVVADMGPLDIVCNNAGINNMLNEGFKNWKGQLAVNLGAVIQGTELARDSFREFGRAGVIINSASIAGLTANPPAPVYSATKWGVVGFTRSLQHWREQSPSIRVAAICPTLVLTEGGQRQLEANKSKKIPSADPGIEPSAVAHVVLRLIAGDLTEEDIVAIGPAGVKVDTTYRDVMSPQYGQKIFKAKL